MLTPLESIRLRALALRSSIHNEQQLSSIELAAMCAKKTNELIDVINDLITLVSGSGSGGSGSGGSGSGGSGSAGVTLEYDELTEEINIR